MITHHINMKHSVKKHACKIKIARFIFLSLFITLSVTTHASAQYSSNLAPDQVENLFKLETNDIDDAFTWINEADTFVVLEKNGDYITPWWNVPNLQMTFYNMLYGQIAVSGYGSGVGKDAANDGGLVPVAGSANGSGAKTALDKWGFHLKTPVYMGERPLISLSVLGVLLPDNVFDGVGRAWDLAFNGQIVSMPTDKDLDTLVYAAPHDYNTESITFKHWVEKNWDKVVKNSLIKPGAVLLSTADDDGVKFGKVWIAQKILYDQGLYKTGLKADYVCSQLEQICGKCYSDVAKCIIIQSGLQGDNATERSMPYDLERMNGIDSEMFHGIYDPRAEMQQSELSTGYGHIFKNMLGSSLVNLSGSLSELSVFLNNLGSLDSLEKSGFNPLILWENSLVKIIVFFALLSLVFSSVKCAFGVLSGRTAQIVLFQRIISSVLLVGLVFGLSVNPKENYQKFKEISNQIFDLGAVSLKNDPQISALYGTGDADDVARVNLWLPYFNSWTLYQTNHSLLDKAQLIDDNVNSAINQPELKSINIPDVAGVKQTAWSTLLADAVSTPVTYSGNVYRAVDHFMAPRVEIKSFDPVDIVINENENYNGNIQSSINWSVLPMQLLLLFVTLINFLMHIELALDISLLLLRLSLAVFDQMGKALYAVKKIGADVVDIMLANTVVCTFVWATLLQDGFLLFAITLLLAVASFNLVKRISLSNSIFAPLVIKKPLEFFVKHINYAWNKIAGENSGRMDNDVPLDWDGKEVISENADEK